MKNGISCGLTSHLALMKTYPMYYIVGLQILYHVICLVKIAGAEIERWVITVYKTQILREGWKAMNVISLAFISAGPD